MTAREMFEELGYKKVEGTSRVYIKYVNEKYKNKTILFLKTHFIYRCNQSINSKEHEAITKQLDELEVIKK